MFNYFVPIAKNERPEFLFAKFITARSVQKDLAFSKEINQRNIEDGDGNDRKKNSNQRLGIFGQTLIGEKEGGNILELKMAKMAL